MASKQQQGGMTRRSFLKKSAFGAAVALSVSMLLGKFGRNGKRPLPRFDSESMFTPRDKRAL
ncbi:MAG: twin-arginine translocation signal domain-containing protein [SAR202 cluster bacterium]|nr:twin-arginine translocation signal domain-containing protein [SAR202 cluster bacterium]